MSIINKSETVKTVAVPVGIATFKGSNGTCSEDTPSSDPSASVLPLALRDTEITEGDVEVLLSVARDKSALTGRYKRVPKKLPEAPRK